MSALVTRRPVAALAAALGAGAAMLVASPAVPASAAGLAASPAAPAAAQTVSITSHPTTSGAISPFSNPLDITCTFRIDPPAISAGAISAGAAVTCTYDRDGTPANVDFLDLNDYLLLNGGTFEDQNEATQPNYYFDHSFVFASCQHGTWSNTVSLGVTFPAGYNPQVASATDTASASGV